MKKIIATLLAAVLCLTFAACGGKKEEAETNTPAESVKIGLITPITGNVAVYGTAVKNAVELYMEQFNAAGGVNGKNIDLIVYDDKGDPTEAMNAYNKLVSADEVIAIVGPVTSAPTFGVAEVSAADNMPCITGTATHPDVTTYGNNFFRACFEDPFQGGTMAVFAANELNAKTAAIIYNTSDAYSTGLYEAFSAKAEEVGLEIVAVEGYAANDVDFNAQLTNIATKNPDVLFIPDYYNNTYLIASQARNLGIQATFLGVDGTDGVLTIEGADLTVFDGMYFANHYSADDTSEMVQSFRSAFEEKYGEVPNALAALGYDAAMILCNALVEVDNAGTALEATPECRQAIIDAMAATDLDCVTGHITFDENNNPIKDCTIIRIQDGAYIFHSKY